MPMVCLGVGASPTPPSYPFSPVRSWSGGQIEEAP